MAFLSRFVVTAILLVCGAHAAMACDGARGISFCCQTMAPFYTNSYVWGNICDLSPSNPNIRYDVVVLR
jgi:hypothetical protein